MENAKDYGRVLEVRIVRSDSHNFQLLFRLQQYPLGKETVRGFEHKVHQEKLTPAE